MDSVNPTRRAREGELAAPTCPLSLWEAGISSRAIVRGCLRHADCCSDRALLAPLRPKLEHSPDLTVLKCGPSRVLGLLGVQRKQSMWFPAVCRRQWSTRFRNPERKRRRLVTTLRQSFPLFVTVSPNWQPLYASDPQQLVRCFGTPSPKSIIQVTRGCSAFPARGACHRHRAVPSDD